jgi:hypothetical protein
MEMVKDSTISFQTTSEICRCLEKLAEQEKQSVPSFVESIVYNHLKDSRVLEDIFQSRRRSERMKVDLPAFIGDPRWQRWEFIAVNIIDLSFGGICFSAPKAIRMVIEGNSETAEFNVIFTLPNTLWPINVKFQPHRVVEGAEDVEVGATLVNPDFYACTALQKYLMSTPTTTIAHVPPVDSGSENHYRRV